MNLSSWCLSLAVTVALLCFAGCVSPSGQTDSNMPFADSGFCSETVLEREMKAENRDKGKSRESRGESDCKNGHGRKHDKECPEGKRDHGDKHEDDDKHDKHDKDSH